MPIKNIRRLSLHNPGPLKFTLYGLAYCVNTDCPVFLQAQRENKYPHPEVYSSIQITGPPCQVSHVRWMDDCKSLYASLDVISLPLSAKWKDNVVRSETRLKIYGVGL